MQLRRSWPAKFMQGSWSAAHHTVSSSAYRGAHPKSVTVVSVCWVPHMLMRYEPIQEHRCAQATSRNPIREKVLVWAS